MALDFDHCCDYCGEACCCPGADFQFCFHCPPDKRLESCDWNVIACGILVAVIVGLMS